MLFSVHVTGRRLSDAQSYELSLQLDATQEDDVLDYLEQSYDWADAATRSVQVTALKS